MEGGGEGGVGWRWVWGGGGGVKTTDLRVHARSGERVAVEAVFVELRREACCPQFGGLLNRHAPFFIHTPEPIV